MTKKPIRALMMALSCSLLTISCGHDHAGHDHEHEEAEAHAGHSHDGDIILDPHMAEHLGVKAEKVSTGEFADVTRATGVIERAPGSVASAPAPTSGTVSYASGIAAGSQVSRGQIIATINTSAVIGGDTEAAARAAAEAARRELERIEALYAEKLVTAAELNAARAAAQTTAAALSKGGKSVVAPIGGTIAAVIVPEGSYVDAGAPVVEVANENSLILRADVAVRNAAALNSVTDARFDAGSLYTVSSLGGRRIAGAPTVDNPGFVTVRFSLPGCNAPVGSSADVWLLGRSREGVVSVPVSALSEQQGLYFVYQAVHPAHGAYRKIPVTIGASDGSRVEILSGLKGGENIVTAGSTAVRLAEMQSVVPEGHSHNH